MVVVIGASNQENFSKITLKTAKIVQAGPHPDTDASKLLTSTGKQWRRRSTQCRGRNRQSIFTTGTQRAQSPLVSNLKPSKLRGVPSLGMLLAAGGDTLQSLVVYPDNVPCQRNTHMVWRKSRIRPIGCRFEYAHDTI